MKMFRSLFLVALFTAAFSLAVPAGAKNLDMTFSKPVVVNGVQLKPGDYTLKVTPNGQVAFVRHDRTVATAEGTVKPLPKGVDKDSIEVDGNNHIRQIRLNKTEVILKS